MSEEALRRALTELVAAKDAEYGINYAPGDQRLLNAWAAARAALSEGQAPTQEEALRRAKPMKVFDEQQLQKMARESALEECASLCVRIGDETAAFYAAAIRVLSEGQAPEPSQRVRDLEWAIVEIAHRMHQEPQHMLMPGLTLIDGDRIRFVLPDGRTLKADARGQAPEPVAQEPAAWRVALGRPCAGDVEWLDYRDDEPDDPLTAKVERHRAAGASVQPLYAHPAGMDAARAKAIEPHPSQGPWCLFLNKHCTRMCCDYCNAYETDRADRALATKGAE